MNRRRQLQANDNSESNRNTAPEPGDPGKPTRLLSSEGNPGLARVLTAVDLKPMVEYVRGVAAYRAELLAEMKRCLERHDDPAVIRVARKLVGLE